MVLARFKQILLFILCAAELSHLSEGNPIEIDNDAWIPDLRGIPVGREGQIVAEFSVSSVPAASSHEEDKSNVEGDLIVRPNKEYSICTDPDENSAEENKIEFKSVLITGKCCWEAFSRPLYNGKKLRMCKGKYTARDLGNLSSNIASIRPVNHTG